MFKKQMRTFAIFDVTCGRSNCHLFGQACQIHDAMREDLIDQHVAYFLRKNPEAKMHKLACSGMIGMH